MATFQELTLRLSTAKNKRAIFMHLIEHVDSTFRDTATGAATRKLLTDDKQVVPQPVFEAIIAQHLTVEVQQLDAEIASIEQSSLSPTSVLAETPAANPS